jgi:hypothetical protein
MLLAGMAMGVIVMGLRNSGFALVTLLLSATAAGAATCPDPAVSGSRVFTLTTSPDSSCLASAPGNLNGNNDSVNQLGYVTLDKSDDTTSGALNGSLTFTPPNSGLSGSFSINAPGYTSFVLALKSGEGQLNPDWAAFLLPSGVLSGTWAISGAQQLSHAVLYGIAAVPLPGALSLLLMALGGLGLLTRRKSLAATSA